MRRQLLPFPAGRLNSAKPCSTAHDNSKARLHFLGRQHNKGGKRRDGDLRPITADTFTEKTYAVMDAIARGEIATEDGVAVLGRIAGVLCTNEKPSITRVRRLRRLRNNGAELLDDWLWTLRSASGGYFGAAPADDMAMGRICRAATASSAGCVLMPYGPSSTQPVTTLLRCCCRWSIAAAPELGGDRDLYYEKATPVPPGRF
jgi:hypothetical protein